MMKVGIMSFAHMHAYSYADCLKQVDGVELIGISDENEERGSQAAKQYNTTFYRTDAELLAQDLDAVIICSENVKHKDMVIQAARAKKHILCEKPIATSVEDATEMIGVCEEEGVILQTAFPVRFSEPMQQLKKAVEKALIGEIVAIRSTNRGQNPGGWFIEKDRSGGGAVLDHTVHMVDIMRWLLNEEISEVTAEVDRFFQDHDIDDAGLLTLVFENGVIASHDASWSRSKNNPTWGDVTIELIGTKGTLRADAFKEHIKIFSSTGKAYQHTLYAKDMDLGLIEDFIQTVREKRTPSITGFDGLKAMEVALAAYASGEKKQPIKLG